MRPVDADHLMNTLLHNWHGHDKNIVPYSDRKGYRLRDAEVRTAIINEPLVDVLTAEQAIEIVHKTILNFFSDEETFTEKDLLLLSVNKAIFNNLRELEKKEELIRQAEGYENEIADLHNRLDIAEYDKERYKEEITTLETKNKGEWIHPYRSDIACECSVCHMQMPITDYFHYCPNCGADMRGET